MTCLCSLVRRQVGIDLKGVKERTEEKEIAIISVWNIAIFFSGRKTWSIGYIKKKVS